MHSRSRLLRTYLGPQKRRASLLAACLVCGIALELLAPVQLSDFVDAAHPGTTQSTLVRIAVTFIVMTIGMQLAISSAGYLGEDVGWRATNAMRVDLVGHCLALDASFHKEHTAGELMERVDGDISVVSQFVSSFLFSVIGRAVLALGILVLVFLADFRIGLVLLVFSLLVTLVMRRIQAVAVPRFVALRRSKADIAGFLEEQVGATEDVRANGERPYVMQRLYGHIEDLMRRARASVRSARAFSSVLEVSVAIATAAVLALGSYLLSHGSIQVGRIFLIYYYTQLLSASLSVLTREFDGLQKASGAMRRIAELYSEVPTVTDGEGGPLPDGGLAIRFESVTFGYTPEQPILKEISFELPAGQTVGVLGRTGSGKTTLSRLLCRDYDTQKGRILIGGGDVRHFHLAALRERIGVVTQEVHLFHATVRENVTLFDSSVSDESVLTAIEELGLTEWYRTLPDGLDTVIVNGGESMSAGEAQLLALTRALLGDPDIVILDEASSRLDPGTEKLVQRATDRLLSDRTGLIIAHRLHTVRKADHVIVLEDGAICEVGPREQLAADPSSRYSALLAGAAA